MGASDDNAAWKILVADDEAPIANVVAMKLRNAGLEVTVALDGQEAYELAMADRPDFLITDLQMPGMNGLELCRAWRRNWTEEFRPSS